MSSYLALGQRTGSQLCWSLVCCLVLEWARVLRLHDTLQVSRKQLKVLALFVLLTCSVHGHEHMPSPLCIQSLTT